jgi:hypothetical protein
VYTIVAKIFFSNNQSHILTMYQSNHTFAKPSTQKDAIIDTAFYMFIAYVLFYAIGISTIAIREIIIGWKENTWEKEPDSKVFEELKYLIYKHSEFTDLDTTEKILNTSIELSKSNQAYRIDCYKSGLKQRMQKLISG